MPVLAPGKPVTVKDPVLQVENAFKPGRYRFELVVTDTAGLESAPAELIVSVSLPAPDPAPEPTPRRPVLRPDVIERVTRPVVRPIDTTPIRPIRRPQ